MDQQRPNSGLEVERRANVIVARFNHQVALSGLVAEAVFERLEALVPELAGRRLLVDFENVQSFSSLMLSKLVYLNRGVEAVGQQMGVFNLAADLRKIMQVTRLDLILLLYNDEADALQGS